MSKSTTGTSLITFLDLSNLPNAMISFTPLSVSSLCFSSKVFLPKYSIYTSLYDKSLSSICLNLFPSSSLHIIIPNLDLIISPPLINFEL